MNYSGLYEHKKRGTFDFPIDLYCVEPSSPVYQMPLHWHFEYELILIVQGSFSLSVDGKDYEMTAGDCAWIGDGVVHGGEPKDCIYKCIVFDLETLLHDIPICKGSAAEFLSNEQGYTGVFKNGTQQARLADLIFNSMEKEQKGYEWTTLGLMWQLMGSLINLKPATVPLLKKRQKIARLKNVLSYIRDNYENSVTLQELADVAGMSPRYFCRAFSAMTGKTPIEYLNYYRVEQAGERLLLTDDSVTEIALACGYNDMSYFSKTFARYKGMNPTAYRKAQ